MTRRHRWTVQAGVVLALASSAAATVEASGDEPAGSGQAVSSLEQYAHAVLAPSTPSVVDVTNTDQAGSTSTLKLTLEPTLIPLGDALVSTGTLGTTTIATDSSGGFSMSGPDQAPISFTPTKISSTASPAAVQNDTAAVYAGTAQATDMVVRPTAAGVETFDQLRNESAPSSFSWKVGLKRGEKLALLDNGSVAVVAPLAPAEEPATTQDASAAAAQDGEPPDVPIADAAATGQQLDVSQAQFEDAQLQVQDHGDVMAVVNAPQAHDAHGASVPTSLSVTGDTVTMTIDHHGRPFSYPIIADPEAEAGAAAYCHAHAGTAFVEHVHNGGEDDFRVSGETAVGCIGRGRAYYAKGYTSIAQIHYYIWADRNHFRSNTRLCSKEEARGEICPNDHYQHHPAYFPNKICDPFNPVGYDFSFQMIGKGDYINRNGRTVRIPDHEGPHNRGRQVCG